MSGKEQDDENNLSTCHKAPAKVSTADEGTSHWVCSKCGMPCDVWLSDNNTAGVKSILLQFSAELSQGLNELAGNGTAYEQAERALDRYYLERVVGALPEKKELPASIEGLDMSSEKDVIKFSDNQKDFGYNEAIEAMQTQLHKELGEEK